MNVKLLDTMSAKRESLIQINDETDSKPTPTSTHSVNTITTPKINIISIPTSNIIKQVQSVEISKDQIAADRTMKTIADVASIFIIPNPGSPVSKVDKDNWDDIFDSSDSDTDDEDPIFSSIDSYSY
ncbi:unnamed protein product [Ambrosiozyma monospora]|nr:unnamed protein product [Ambrosiozyma monospora]